VIYLSKPGDEYEVPIGSFLGDMSSELAEYGEGAYIDRFVSGGPKNYGFRVRKADGETVSKVKIRGFTQDAETTRKLNRETMERSVQEFLKDGTVEKTSVVRPQIVRTKKQGEIVTKMMKKDYSVVYEKRRVFPDGRTLPFGY